LFELAYLPSPPSSRRRPSRACCRVQRRTGVAVRDTPSPRRSASRRIRKRRAHPIELTAVSAIVLDLLSGFQRPSRRSPDLHQSGDGPTLLRSASEAVKHPLEAGTPVISGTYTSIHEVFWRPSERTQPAADPEVVRPRGRPTYSRGRTLSTWRFDCGSSPARPPRPLPSPDHHEGRAR